MIPYKLQWNRDNSLKNKLKIEYLLEETNLQKQKIAKLVGIDNACVSKVADGHFPKRRATALSQEELEDYLDYCDALDVILPVEEE